MDPDYPLSSCPNWSFDYNRIYFQIGCALFAIGFLIPHKHYVTSLICHAFIAASHVVIVVWGIVHMCSPDVFGWNLLFLLFNLVHGGFYLWKCWPVPLQRELTDLYTVVFKPFDVKKQDFVELCGIGKVCTLKNGECYAEEGITPTGNLSLVIYGKVKVYCGGEFLHHILDKQFLDSPEWDAYDNHFQADKFQVTLKATSYCKYLMWQRETLQEYLSVNPFMRHVFLHLIGHDVAKKLILLTERQWNHVGVKPDIRLSAFEAEQLQ